MRSKKGVVKSSKMDKTISVVITRYVTHEKYKKRFKVQKTFYAHDPENAYKEGEEVVIYETKPLSKTKRWTVVPPENSKEEQKTA